MSNARVHRRRAAASTATRCQLSLAQQKAADQPHQGDRWSGGSTTDAIADVRGLRRVDHPYDLQLDA